MLGGFLVLDITISECDCYVLVFDININGENQLLVLTPSIYFLPQFDDQRMTFYIHHQRRLRVLPTKNNRRPMQSARQLR